MAMLCYFCRKMKKWWRGRDNVREEHSKMPQWELDYDLVETHQQGLFYEYLEMGKYQITFILKCRVCLLSILFCLQYPYSFQNALHVVMNCNAGKVDIECFRRYVLLSRA